MEQKEIINKLKNIKTEFKEIYSIRKLGIFGSFAKGSYSDSSDIDIVVELEDPTMFNLIGIKQEIEERLNKKVDIVRLRERMNQYLKQRIEKEAVYV